MLEWGINIGIEWNEKLSVHDFEDIGRGVIANHEIKQDEVLISIPEKFLIHSKSKFSLEKLNPPIIKKKKSFTKTFFENNLSPSPIFYKPFHDSVNKFDSKQRISFHLIIEKLLKKNSIWYNYLNDLPTEYNITSTYDDDEIEHLGYPIYVEKVLSLKNEMLESFDSFKEILMNNYKNDLNRIVIKLNDNSNDDDDDDDENITIKLKEIIDFNLYRWCWGTIQSRTYFYDRNMKDLPRHLQLEDKDDCALVPLADLFNHSSDDVNTETKFDEKKQCYQVITKTKFEKDSQVFISYGKHSNFTLLNHYGFIIENNSNDSIPLLQEDAIPDIILEKEMKQDLKSYERKMSILEQYGLSVYGEDSKFLVSIDKELPFSWNYLSILKVLYMTNEELNNQCELNLFHYDLPISNSNHEKVLYFLKNLSIIQLTQFKNYLKFYNKNFNYNNNNNDNDGIISGDGSGDGNIFNNNNNNIHNGIGKRFEISYILEYSIKVWEGCTEWVDQQLHFSLNQR
ncbi:hypothetical protein ACTFIR_001296 [Dictyostelium discoideum]